MMALETAVTPSLAQTGLGRGRVRPFRSGAPGWVSFHEPAVVGASLLVAETSFLRILREKTRGGRCQRVCGEVEDGGSLTQGHGDSKAVALGRALRWEVTELPGAGGRRTHAGRQAWPEKSERAARQGRRWQVPALLLWEQNGFRDPSPRGCDRQVVDTVGHHMETA